MAFNNYLEDENDKPYFTTNSLAYYYDKMEGFAKAVEGSAKALNLTKEEIEQRIALRLAEWDKNLETFDGSVEKLLTEWVDDGTLSHVIDSTLIEQKIIPVSNRLTEMTSTVNERFSNEDIVITVGVLGDVTTLNQAIEKATLFIPRHSSSKNRTVIIRLTAGFIMSEQVIIHGLNLSHITLESEDVEVLVKREMITKGVGNSTTQRYPLFLFDDGAVSPKINVLFNMDGTGIATQRNGFYARNGSHVTIAGGKGIKNAGGRGLHVGLGSTAVANGAIFTGSGELGMRAGNNSTIVAEGVDVSGSVTGISATTSVVDCMDSTFNGCTLGVSSNTGSKINADESSFLNTTRAIEVIGMSELSAVRSVIESVDFIICSDGSTLSLIDAVVTTPAVSVSVINSFFNCKRAKFTSGNISISSSDNSRISMAGSTFTRVTAGGGVSINMENSISTFTEGNAIVLGGGGNHIAAHGAQIINSLPVNVISQRGIIYKEPIV